MEENKSKNQSVLEKEREEFEEVLKKVKPVEEEVDNDENTECEA